MKFRLALFSTLLFAVSAFAQTVAPATTSVTFDKSTQTSASFGPVTLTAPNTTDYFYAISIPAQYASVIAPVGGQTVGLIPAGTSAQVSFGSGSGLSALAVGSYTIAVSFVPLYVSNPLNPLNTVTYTITLNVTNSRTYVLPGANDLTIPHLAAGDVWKTRIRLVNTTGTASINELRLFNANGQPATYLVNGFSTNLVPAITVPAHGTVEFIVDAAVLKTGTATIHTSQGSMPGVNVSYICSNPRFESAVEIKPSNSSGFTVAFENNSATRRSTGIAISNALNYDQIVTLEFLDANGQSLLPVGATNPRVTIPAGGQYISTIDNDYAYVKNQKGVIRVTGTQPTLAGFGLIFDLSAGSFYTEPAFAN